MGRARIDASRITASLGMVSFRLVQTYLLLTLAYGVWLGRTGVIVHNGIGLLATLLPAIVSRRLKVRLAWPLVLWIALPVFLHAIGIVNGLYHAEFWWDKLTHVTSSTLVAAVGYTTVRTIDVHSEGIHLPDRFLFLFVLLFAMAAGVCWEVLEWALVGLEGVLGIDLIGHGPLTDTMEDLSLDLVGGLVTAVFARAYLAEAIPFVPAMGPPAEASTDE